MDSLAENKGTISGVIWKFAPFWLFLVFFKFGAGLHYSLLSPLGARILPLWVVGASIGFASLVQLLLDVPVGKLLDRFGYKKLMLIGVFFFIISAFCLTFTFSIFVYAASIFFSIFGWLLCLPGANAYVLSSASKDRSGVFMSFRDISSSLGIVFASAILSFVLFLTPRQMGWFMIVLLTISFLALALAPHEKRKIPNTEAFLMPHRAKREFKHLFETIKKLNPASSSILLLHLASGIFYSMIWFVVPIVIQAQIHSELLGIGLGIFDLSVVLLGFVLGILADRANKRRLVFFGLLIFAVFGMLLGLNFGILFLLFGFLATAGEELAGLSLWSWLYTLDENHTNDGRIAGVINLFEDFGWMIGPLMAGILYGLIGPSWTIVVGAMPILVVWFVYQLNTNEHTPHHGIVDKSLRLPRRHHKS